MITTSHFAYQFGPQNKNNLVWWHAYIMSFSMPDILQAGSLSDQYILYLFNTRFIKN